MGKKLEYRTVFLSDIHIGSRGCRAEEVIAFLKSVKCEKLYLVGDILDMWRLRKRWHWPAEHNEVVRRLLKTAKKGTEVIYIPGNHDEWARGYEDVHFGGVRIRLEDVHETADGRKLLVTHGDQFDMVVKHARLISMLGSWAYDSLLLVNRWYNGLRRLMGLQYWSLSKYLKNKVKSACVYVSQFEEALIDEAQRKGYHGVVCGHIHQPEIRLDEIEYYNCGDCVESCTAIAEDHDGRMRIIDLLNLDGERERQGKLRLKDAEADIDVGRERAAGAAASARELVGSSA